MIRGLNNFEFVEEGSDISNVRMRSEKKAPADNDVPRFFGRKIMQTFRNQLLVLLIVTAILCSGCFKSHNVVTKIPPASGKPVRLDGVPYALPRTVIKVALPFKKVDKAPGEFEAYTPCFFSPDVAASRVKKEESIFSLNPPTFGSRGEPDPDERYIAKIKGGYFENKTLLLEFNGDGVITKGDASSENTAIDVAIKTARTAVSIGAKLATGGAADANNLPNRAAEKAALEKAQLNAKIDVCRATLVAEAAAAAAAAAMKTAEASGNPGEVNAAEAQKGALQIRHRLAAAQSELTDSLISSTAAFNDGTVIPAGLGTSFTNLVDEVVCDARYVAMRVRSAADAASPAADKEKSKANIAADKADELTKFIGKKNTTTQLDPAHRPGCYTEEDIPLVTSAFDSGYVAASEKFARIVALKLKREDIASGGAAFQGLSVEALQKMLDETDNTIKSYETTFFLGTKDAQTWTGNFEFTPGKSVVSNAYNAFQTSPVLLVFSKSDGICETAESKRQGVRINADFIAAKCPLPDTEQAIWLSVNRITSDDSYLGHMAAANARDEGNGERGFYYRIPARSVVKLELGRISAANELLLYTQSLQGQGWRRGGLEEAAPAGVLYVPIGNEVGRDTMRVAQLGVTASIPASAAGRKTQYTIDFDESTGALKNFKLASNALLEKSIVDEASGAASDIVAAKQARDKAKAEAKDLLAQKKRELELLKTDNAIDEEKKKKAAQQP